MCTYTHQTQVVGGSIPIHIVGVDVLECHYMTAMAGMACMAVLAVLVASVQMGSWVMESGTMEREGPEVWESGQTCNYLGMLR